MVMTLASPELYIDHLSLYYGKELFRALNHALRQKMIQLIHMHGRMTVTELFTKMKLEQSVASNHLALLRSQKLLLTERQQKFVFYSVNYSRLKEVEESVGKFLAAVEDK
jgi:DNA-binding transcriptional ArsR family regulator